MHLIPAYDQRKGGKKCQYGILACESFWRTYYAAYYIHSMDSQCATKTVGRGTSYKYTNIQIYSVKYYKHFT